MAILNIYLDLEYEYINLIKDVYKVLVILIVFQIMVSLSTQKNIINNALTGSLLNDDFMIILIFIIISISSYYLIFDRILKIE
jgi:hypothetical protein